MKLKMMMASLFVAAMSGLSAYACIVPIRVACPNDKGASGVLVSIDNQGSAYTDELGIASIDVLGYGSYTVRVSAGTLPAGATIKVDSKKINVTSEAPPFVEFVIGGSFCEGTNSVGECWLTGGGTIGRTKGSPDYSFGGVVYPGCSSQAAGGGNWNVVYHAGNLHFKGKDIIVTSCGGVPTRSPKVNVNVINFTGTGTLTGVGGDSTATMNVEFTGRAVDNMESGGGSDQLYLKVTPIGGGATLLQIGNTPDDPATISTGNLQIHTSSCN